MPALRLEQVSRDNTSAFYRLHCDKHQAGFCFCVAWYVESWSDWEERTAEQNRAIREQLFADGVQDGFLAFAEGAEEPVAWVQAAPRDTIPRLARQFQLAPDPETWAIGCLLIRPDWRGRGIARHLIEQVLEQLRSLGAIRVEAFPRSGQGHPPEELWNGPLSLYISLGFEITQPGEPRTVVARQL